MPDLLTHVLAAYVLATLLSFRYEWITPQYVTAAMVGAVVPDLAKISLLVPSYQVGSALGVPFDWFAIHTIGGSLVVIALCALLTGASHRRRVFLLLALGAASHHALDALLITSTGYSYAIFWPVSTYHPPSPGLFLSTDRWPAAVSGAAAATVWYVRSQWSVTESS